MMVPEGGPSHETSDALRELLDPGEVVVDGRDFLYTDAQRLGRSLGEDSGEARRTVQPAVEHAVRTGRQHQRPCPVAMSLSPFRGSAQRGVPSGGR
jgi:hypothetical protein